MFHHLAFMRNSLSTGKKSTDTDYISLGVSSSAKFELVDVEDGINYDVRARIISGLGTRSPFATVTRKVVGKTAPCARCERFFL